MRPLLLFPLLLGPSALALAAPTIAPKTPTPASVPAKPALEKINVGELRLDGKISALLGSTSWQLDAISWTSPRGVTTEFEDVKSKAIQLAPDAFVHPLGRATKVDPKNVKLKTSIAVIGKNRADGTVVVREVILLAGYGDLSTVGTLSSNAISSNLIAQSRRAREAGQLTRALDLARKAAETASGMGDLSGEALSIQDVGILYSELKQPQNALESYKRGQMLGERLNNPLVQVLGLEGQGDVLASGRQFDQAIALLERAATLSIRTESGLQTSVLGSLVDVYTAAKKPSEAVGALIRLFPLEEASGKYDEATGTLLSLARLQAKSDASSSQTYLDQARARMNTIRDESARLSLTVLFASTLKETGDTQGAATQYEVAAKLAEAKGDTTGAAAIRALATKAAAPAPTGGAAANGAPAGPDAPPAPGGDNGNAPQNLPQ